MNYYLISVLIVLALNVLAFYNWQIPYMTAAMIAMVPSLVLYPFFYLIYQLRGDPPSASRIWETTFFSVLFYVVLPVLGFPYFIISHFINGC